MQARGLLGAWVAIGGLSIAAAGTSEHLNAALAAYHRNDFEGAYSAAVAAASDADFPAQDERTRHSTLSLAAEVALKTNRPEQAQLFATRATLMSEQSVADWRNRLFAAMRTHDGRDEAESLTMIARNWGRDPSTLPAETVVRVLQDTREPQFRDARFNLLQALYELRWQPGEGRSASRQWRELSLLLLENNDSQRAQQVASLVTDPYEIIAMRADLRYRPLLKSKYFDSDPKRAARRQIESLQASVSRQPRSLAIVRRWADALMRSRRDAEAIAAIDQAEIRIEHSAGGTSAYDDIDANYSGILNTKANALRNLGRFDEAVNVLQKAVELPHRVDLVSQPINLAELLCGLNRPDQAAKWLPPLENASAYGKAQIYLVRLTAALERDDRPEVDRTLSYLRQHRADAPGALQEALLRAGELADARQALLDRLADPILRSVALADIQTYFERPRPPKDAEWRARALKLSEDPAVRAEIEKIGVIERYLWRYPDN
jgi:tetratricopeptide (TPR) repeat protein